MKPISLKIRGLNSFNEEQFIDFEELTSEGLFGIFGPTGSGKSTVLDGITLALYGEVARNSSNIINTNCSSLAVSYRFQISAAVTKRYEVNREFKRDKKSGNPQSGKCRITDITDEDNPVVLADKVREVNSACRNIIGLGIDDFTRTVVLPQGKFSEFLKLEGKNRRDMLERLFNLQEYGESLAKKLKDEITRLNFKLSELQGQISGYEGISGSLLESKKEELKAAEEALRTSKTEMAVLEKKYSESEKLWNLILELNAQKKIVMALEEKKPEIDKKTEVKERGEAAGKVMPLITNYKGLKNDFKEVEERLKAVSEKLNNVKTRKAGIESSWEECNRKKEEELPKLKVLSQKYSDAVEEEKTIAVIKDEIEELEISIKENTKNLEDAEKELNTVEGRLETGKTVTEETEREVKRLTVSSELKEKVQKAVILNEKCKGLSDIINRDENKISTLKAEMEAKSKEQLLLIKNKDEEIIRLEELTNQKKLLEEGCPGTQDELMAMQQRMIEKCDAWEKYNSNCKDIKANEEAIQTSNISLLASRDEERKLSSEVEAIKLQLKDIQVENLAHHLRESLKDGDICPVCGSREHHIENIKAVKDASENQLNDELKEKEEKLKECQSSSAVIEARMNSLKELNEKLNKTINDLGIDFKEKTAEELRAEFESFRNKLKDYTEKKEKLEGESTALSENIKVEEGRVNSSKALIESIRVQIDECGKDKADREKELSQHNEELRIITASTGVSDFEAKSKEIQDMEREKQKQENKLQTCRELYQKLLKKKEEKQNLKAAVNNELTRLNSMAGEKKSNVRLKEAALESKFGRGVSYSEELKKTDLSINEIEQSYIRLSGEKKNIEEEFNSLNEEYIETNTKHGELKLRISYELKNVETALDKEKFASVDEVYEKFLEEKDITIIGDEIKKYETEAAKAAGAVENITGRIAGRELTDEQWEKIKEAKADKEAEIQDLNEKKIKLDEEVKTVKKKLEELGGILKDKEKLDHKAALLADLDKLFKGKRFVEYVASHRLKYIAGKASKELKEISSGTYGIEVDENGSFIIRDYKNGGAARDASTLSGGETFLASLALALALSNEIQLKGTAPLELFFLDEGFGTLDDELLDTVMDSLEKIHNDKLKIGIISHVESIKNRVPVKLILTPAEAGVAGSRVKIERN